MVVNGWPGSVRATRSLKGALICQLTVLPWNHYIPLASHRSALGGFFFLR